MSSSAPQAPPTKGSIAGVIIALLLVHGLSLVVLWLFFALLRWTGENGILGLLIRAVGSIPILVLAGVGAVAAAEHHGRATGAMVRALAFAAAYLILTLLVTHAIRDPSLEGPPLIFPRAGAIHASPDLPSLLAAAFINPGIVMIVFFGLIAASANKKRKRESAYRRLCEVPCTRCGGRMREKGDHLECEGCGLHAAMPNEADVEALARTLEPPPK